MEGAIGRDIAVLNETELRVHENRERLRTDIF